MSGSKEFKGPTNNRKNFSVFNVNPQLGIREKMKDVEGERDVA